jgi:hypothetical protein
MPHRSHRLPGWLAVLLAFVVCGCATALAGGSAHASTAQPAGEAAADIRAHGPRHKRRVGGSVQSAWPKTGKAPRTQQARWLARQVGALRPRPCAKQWRRARVRCRLDKNLRVAPATMSAVAGDPGSPAGRSVRIAAATPRQGGATARAVATATLTLPLQLVRSYEIPVDDPSYRRLLNWSWTYDSAVAAAAFAATGDKANATQLLDQLAALQYTDGSLEIAFDTATAEGARVFRSGTVAWAGLAAATYDKTFRTDRYLDTQEKAADYLLSLQESNGLVRGGPDVKWISTQHNLIAYVFLARLGEELLGDGDTKAASRYWTAAAKIASGINANLLVTGKSAHFRQGANDDTLAVDVQALGAMYLQGTGQTALAAQVLAYAQSTFAVGDRSVKKSSDPDTYNMTYESSGPFSGYAPYAGAGAPIVRWAEASGQMRLAQATLGQDTKTLDKSIASWAAITKKDGPLQADKTVTSKAYGVEYHVWPASTAAAWTVLAQSAPTFFAAPRYYNW